MRKNLTNFLNDEAGLANIEYAMLLAFTAAILVTALGGVAGGVTNAVETACAQLGGACSNAADFVQRTVLGRR